MEDQDGGRKSARQSPVNASEVGNVAVSGVINYPVMLFVLTCKDRKYNLRKIVVF